MAGALSMILSIQSTDRLFCDFFGFFAARRVYNVQREVSEHSKFVVDFVYRVGVIVMTEDGSGCRILATVPNHVDGRGSFRGIKTEC